jgi:hypothetical protein
VPVSLCGSLSADETEAGALINHNPRPLDERQAENMSGAPSRHKLTGDGTATALAPFAATGWDYKALATWGQERVLVPKRQDAAAIH